MPLAPPPELTYPSVEAADQAMFEHADMEQFDLVQLRSHRFGKESDKPLKDVIYACKHHGDYISRAHENGRPVQKSRKSECRFQVKLKRGCSGIRDAIDDNTWSLKILHAGHNHEAADISSYPRIGNKPVQANLAKIERQNLAGIAPRFILRTLQIEANRHINAREIYNAKYNSKNCIERKDSVRGLTSD